MKHHQCLNSELISPSNLSCCLLPVTAEGEENPVENRRRSWWWQCQKYGQRPLSF